jgi:hypothetical protein
MTRDRSLLFLTSGIILVVSFIALAGFLNNIVSIWKIIWELAYLVLGALIIRLAVSNKAFLYSSVFYAVNLLIVVIVKILGVGSAFFATLAILLMAAGFVFSVLNIARKHKPVHVAHKEMEEAFKDIESKPSLAISEYYGEAPKPKKKAKKKTKKKKR